MPVQVQTTNLAQKLGKRLTAAYNATKGKPVREDKGARLPAGINGGVAQLISIKYGKYKADSKKGLAGKDYIMFQAIAVSPESHEGSRVAGTPLQPKIIPYDDTPELPKKTFAEHWDDIQNLFQQLGVNQPDVDHVPEDQRHMAIWDYYQAAITHLTADQTKRPYFSFRTWKGEKQTTGPYAGKEPLTNETWGRKIEYNGVADPGAGVTEHQPGTNGDTTALQPEPFTEPPMGSTAEATQEAGGVDPNVSEEPSQEDIIMALVEVANTSPVDGESEEETNQRADAADQLKQYALAAGATEEQVTNAENWEAVAAMALGNLPEAAASADPKVGDARKFKKRNTKGEPLADVKNKKVFPPIDIEIVSVDAKNKTVTAKDKAGKPVTAIGGKTPLAIKWEWLE